MTEHSTTRAPFGERLAAVAETRGALCVGIDPHPHLLERWGLGATADGIARFADICVEAFGDLVAIVKPQVAFFEAYGSQGLQALENTIAGLHEQGALVLADAKRGDIGSTMEAYAQAWLSDESPLASDAVTLSPYLGFGSLQPAIDLAHQTGRGLFILAATSNPDGPSVQHSTTTEGVRLDQSIVDACGAVNNTHRADGAVGSVGIVLGATVTAPPQLEQLNGPVLLPGVGAQGATYQDVSALTAAPGLLVLPSISRSVLSAGPEVSDLRKAVKSQLAEMAAATQK